LSSLDVSKKYDAFQADAVFAVVQDFAENPKGRYLLVIPTGGGKTFTAAKSVCEMYRRGLLDSKQDRVLWTAHRTELIAQAKTTLERVIDNWGLDIKVDQQVCVQMISEVQSTLGEDVSIRLVVIDEAHHGAANSYQCIFGNKAIGVLGLTATPSRHDGMPLDFDRESYSIGFPDLVRMGVILRPTVHSVAGGKYDIDGYTEEDLLQLDDAERDQRIAALLLKNKDKFRKIIVYVGTKNHAEHLVDRFKAAGLESSYESISYITGEGNSRNQERTEFIDAEKAFDRSILVNVQVLSEGYDDPKVNTVVMAAPSKSKLYYMQALGRAIRQDPGNLAKEAHVVEVIDDLPNIRYRIDNRWLYSDISDALEPYVIDCEYSSNDTLTEKLDSLYDEYQVGETYRVFPDWNDRERYSMLLFKQYGASGTHYHFPILIDGNNRLAVGAAYNFLSERMNQYVRNSYNYEQVFRVVSQRCTELASGKDEKRFIYDAMSNASRVIQDTEKTPEFVKKGSPWITFAAFHYRKRDCPKVRRKGL
jgi:superfamily II DNA or RNA helicase